MIKTFIISLLLTSCSTSQINKTVEIVKKNYPQNSTPTKKEMSLGLKETLSVGFTRAVNSISKQDGFLKNPSIKIPIPNDIKKITSSLNKLGFNNVENKLETLINRSAEKASSEAKTIFISAIKELTIQDAMKILMGRKNEATNYLKSKNSEKLRSKFKPIIYNSLNKQGSLDYYTKISSKYNMIPFVDKVESDPTKYVMDKAMDGIFKSIAKEESLIRDNPIKRSTMLLKKVFNYVDSKKN